MQLMTAVLTAFSSRCRASFALCVPGVHPGKSPKSLTSRKNLKGLVVPLMLLVAGCSSVLPENGEPQPLRRLPTDAEVEQYNAQVAPEERIVCRDETRVGSNIPQRTCRYIRDMEETSRSTRDQLRNILH